MSIHQSHNYDCSQKYLKFLVRLKFEGSFYYTIWGEDSTTFHKEDKVLIDEDDHFLLFADTEPLFRFTENVGHLFDTENFSIWLNNIIKPVEPDATINIDALNYDANNLEDAHLFTELVDAKNFVSDYADQVNNDLITDLVLSDQLMELYNAYMDNYVWSGEKKPIRSGLAEEVTPLLKKLFAETAKCIKIIT